MTDDIFFAGIADLNARLRKREFSTVELVKAFAERLATLADLTESSPARKTETK